MMENKYAYINRSYFRRARNTESWALDSSYIKVRVIIRRRKRDTLLYLIAHCNSKVSDCQELSTSQDKFSRQNSLHIPEDSYQSFDKKKIPLSIIKDIQVQTKDIRRQIVFQLTLTSNNIIAGTRINLYHDCFFEIDKLHCEINSFIHPKNIFRDYYENMYSGKSSQVESLNSSRSWLVKFFNNVTLQSIGVFSEYLHVLHVNLSRLEIRDINQTLVFSFPLIHLLNFGNINGWYYLEFVLIPKSSSKRSTCKGFLVFESSATCDIQEVLHELRLSTIKKYPSDACLYVPRERSRPDFGSSMKQKRRAVHTNSSPAASNANTREREIQISPEPLTRKLSDKLNFFSRKSRNEKPSLQRMWSTGSAESSSDESVMSISASTSRLNEFGCETDFSFLRSLRRMSKGMRLRRENDFYDII